MAKYIDADILKTRMINYYSYSFQLCEEISDFFDNTPMVDVRENVYGKWINKGHHNLYECSKCHDIWEGIGGYNFCPNCGTDMRG